MLQDVLKELRQRHNVTAKTVAEAVGILPDTYRSYETGRREPNLKTLVLIADYFNVTTDYLLGRAPMTNPLAMLDLQVDVHEDVVMEQYMQLPKEWRKILLEIMKQLGDAAERGERGQEIQFSRPSIPMKQHQNKAAAGFGYDLSEDDEWFDIEVVDTPEARRADFAVEVDGDSMEPDYHDGDIVLIKLDPDVPLGAVGLFRVEDKGYIKERGADRLISRNPEYPDIEGEAQCIGLVIGIAELV